MRDQLHSSAKRLLDALNVMPYELPLPGTPPTWDARDVERVLRAAADAGDEAKQLAAAARDDFLVLERLLDQSARYPHVRDILEDAYGQRRLHAAGVLGRLTALAARLS